jgi:hypothetical protein
MVSKGAFGTGPSQILKELSDIKSYYPTTDEYYSYYLPDSTSILQALSDLDRYVQAEGPFDGVMGFSQGAGLLATYMIRLSEEHAQMPLPFKCAVFFSAANTFDWRALQQGHVKLIEQEAKLPLLSLPTAHIWGVKDQDHLKEMDLLSRVCDKRLRYTYVHSEGHEIPSARMGDAVQGCIAAIRRAVEKATVDS